MEFRGRGFCPRIHGSVCRRIGERAGGDVLGAERENVDDSVLARLGDRGRSRADPLGDELADRGPEVCKNAVAAIARALWARGGAISETARSQDYAGDLFSRRTVGNYRKRVRGVTTTDAVSLHHS